MLAQAAKTRLYDALHEGDLVGFLRSRPAASVDLVVAADVFVYVADLAGTSSPRPGGCWGGAGSSPSRSRRTRARAWCWARMRRYAHGEPLLRDLAEAAGLAVVLFERVSTREDRGEPVPGFLVVAERG